MGSKENILKKAMAAVFNYSNDETLSGAARSPRVNEGDLCFGSNSFVSFVRGVEYGDSKSNNENHSTPIKPLENGKLKEGTCSFIENQSLQISNISDSEFFDSDKRKEVILSQSVIGTSLQEEADCTGCSKWVTFSQKNITAIPSFDVTKFNKKRRVSIGEFFGEFSETLSDSQIKHQLFKNVNASTPIPKRRCLSMSSLMGAESNVLSAVDSSQKDSSFFSSEPKLPFKISTPKWRKDSNSACGFHYYIGSTARKNIDRLRKEESYLRHRAETSFAFLMNGRKSNTYAVQSKNFSNDTRSTIPLPCSSLATSTVDEWFIEPQSVTLDRNKGNRVRLVNNSTKNLKYKAAFDSRMTNISPLSGTVPAMDEIGLRILISQYAKKEYEDFECNINIIVGKSEKSIHVKYTKEEKEKRKRKRTFMLH